MKPGEFAALVQCMREAQKEYFKTRKPSALHLSKELEKKVDDEIKEQYRQSKFEFN